MTPLQFPFKVRVKYGGGTYTTQTVGSARGSSTSSPETAIGRLVDKLTPAQLLEPGDLRAVPLPDAGLPVGVTVWRIERAA